MEKATDMFTPDDIVLIALVTAKVHANLKVLRKKHSSPEVFGEKGIIQLTHKDRLWAFSFLFNINDIDPNKFYKPEDLGGMVLKQTQAHPNVDSSLWDTSSSKVSAKDMHRALEELERIIDLKHVENRDIRKIAKRYQIKFTGKPSLYQFPNDITKLKRIYSDPALVEVIIKALVKLGLVDDLSFFLKGITHSLLNNYQNERSEAAAAAELSPAAAANKIFDIVTNTYPLSLSDIESLNISDLSPFREYLSSIAKGDLNEFVRAAACRVIEIPTICLPILMLFLLRTEVYDRSS